MRPQAIRRTRRERGPELLGLFGVVEDEGVEVARAPDLELDDGREGALLRLTRRLLDPAGCEAEEGVISSMKPR